MNYCDSKNKKNGLRETEKLNGFLIPQNTSFEFSESPQKRIEVRISQEQMLRGKQHSSNVIQIYAVLYEGIHKVTESEEFRDALRTGIGHGKVVGLGLLSVVPIV